MKDTTMIDYALLRKHILTLAGLAESDSPVISAYLDLQQPHAMARADFRAWASMVRQTFGSQQRRDFDDAVEEIEAWLPQAQGRGAAVFARWGEHPMMLPMNFDAPLETHFHVGPYPVIYPLVELKDRFNRFVVVITTAESAKIIEVNLGAHSVELLTDRPALRTRIGREWTRQHYMNHRRDRERAFLKEKVAVIRSLMAKRGHNSLIVAGDPRWVSSLVEALPKALQDKVVSEIKTGFADYRLGEIMDLAVEAFLKAEHEESLGTVDRLVEAVRAGRLAAIGSPATLRALREGRVSELVISTSLLHDEREELIRLASKQGLAIETVQDCSLLDAHGGVGALLRYEAPSVETIVEPEQVS